MGKTVLDCNECIVGSWSSTDDRLYAHEAAGLLVGGEDLSQEQQLSYLSALMQPLLSQIEQNLPRIKQTNQTADGTDAVKSGSLPVNLILQVKLCTCFAAYIKVPDSQIPRTVVRDIDIVSKVPIDWL